MRIAGPSPFALRWSQRPLPPPPAHLLQPRLCPAGTRLASSSQGSRRPGGTWGQAFTPGHAGYLSLPWGWPLASRPGHRWDSGTGAPSPAAPTPLLPLPTLDPWPARLSLDTCVGLASCWHLPVLPYCRTPQAQSRFGQLGAAHLPVPAGPARAWPFPATQLHVCSHACWSLPSYCIPLVFYVIISGQNILGVWP